MSAPLPTWSTGAAGPLDKLLRETVASGDFPAVFMGAASADRILHWNQYGNRVYGDPGQGPVDEKTTTELYSQTKLITWIAALQLVDRGLVWLDNEEDVWKWLPEIGSLAILEGYDSEEKPVLVKPTRTVTLRMLMSHSADGPIVQDLARQAPRLPTLFFRAGRVESLCAPLAFQPGTSWLYGVAIDWVGVLVERISGITLENYMRKNIFDPAGAKSLTFLPANEIRARKMAMCTRGPGGAPTVNINGFGMNRPTTVQGTRFFSGGGGLYGTQKDYLRVLQAILRSDPRHGHLDPLISPNSFAELFKDSIPTGEGYTGTSGISLRVLPHGYFEPPATPDRVNHSVAGLLNLYDFPGRRKARSVCWAGAAKTQWWIDPTTGLAGVVGTQLLPPGSDPWYKVYVAFETAVYAAALRD